MSSWSEYKLNNKISTNTASSWQQYKKQREQEQQNSITAKVKNTITNTTSKINNFITSDTTRNALQEINNIYSKKKQEKEQKAEAEKQAEKSETIKNLEVALQKAKTPQEKQTIEKAIENYKNNTKNTINITEPVQSIINSGNLEVIHNKDGFAKASSAFDDGYQFGDVSKTVLSTAGDAALNVGKGIMNIGEGIGDLATYGIAGIADLTGNKEYAEKLRYNASHMNVVDNITKPMINAVDKNSILGNKSDEVAQGLGYVAGNTAIAVASGGLGTKLGLTSKIAQTAGSMGTTFTSSMGHGMTEAYQNGATDDEAFAYGLISAVGETGSELMFGGLGKASKAVGLSKGAGELDDIVIGGLTKNIKNKMAKILVQSGLKATGEGAEEVVSGLISAIGKKATYMSEEELGQILKDENLAEQFWMGTLTSVIAQTPSTMSSIKNKTDYITREKYNESQKNKPLELAKNVQISQEQQTILNNNKTAQNGNMKQIEQNNINAPIKELNYFETARKYNIDTRNDTIQNIARVTNERGINARYDADIFTDNSQNAMWRINKDESGNITREVILNPNADTSKTLENIILHELTHDLEGTEEYNKLKDIILKYDKSKTGYQESRQSLEDLYSQVYDKDSIEFQSLVDNEAVADVLGSKLGDQEFLNNLTIQNRTLSQKIYDWVVDKLNKINAKIGYKSEKLYWTDVKNKLENAFKQEYQNVDSKTKYSIAGKKGMNNIIKSNPKNIDLERMYNKAQQMQKNGIDNETIRQQTNWFQDRNGDWKFEFSDKDMSIKSNVKLESNKIYKLGDILEHDTLFMLYPELADYKIKVVNNSKINGSFSKTGKIIKLDDKLIRQNKSIEGTLLHEIQHAIQNIEGFEYGKSSKGSKLAYYNSLGEIEAADTKERFLQEKYNNKNISSIAPESSKENPQHKNLNNYLKNRNVLDKVKDSVYNYSKNKNRGGNNEISQEIMAQDYSRNRTVVDGRGRIESENNSDSFNFDKNNYSLNSKGTWQDRLDTLYKNNNKGTTIRETKAPIKEYLDNKNDREIAPVSKTNKEYSIKKYDNYKNNIIKANENTINNLISYKNETTRSIDNKIAEKQKLLNSKKNKDTKTANTIRSQIENLKVQKTQIENLYNEKIDKFNSKISKEKIELETRNMMKQEARNTLKAEIEPLIKDLTQYKDKKAGIWYNRETAQRNIDDIVQDKDLASAIKETIFDPVQVHQAEKTREINDLFKKINDLELDKTKKYYYVPENEIAGIKIDEATLAQLIIEKKINDTDLRNYGLDDTGIDRIHNTANTFEEILNYLYGKMNEEQIKYGYSPIGKIENYFPHFFENKPDTMLSKIASYFGIDLTNQNLPTEIAGKTDTFKPGRTWDSNIQKRQTNKTDYDALVAMEKYIIGAADLIYTTEDIQRVREYSRQIRYKYSDKGIQTEIDSIMNNNELTQESKDSALDGIFKNTKNELSNFVTWLDDYANTLSNKKAFADRSMERNIGRNMYNSMSGIEGRIAANTIGGNLSVSLTNFAPIFQAAGTTKWNYLLTGMLQTTSNNIKGITSKSKDISFVTNSNFLTNRFGTDTISQKKITQKMSDIASMPMNVIDEFTSESIVRAKYLENIDKGMTEEKALDSADKYAAKIMADRSKGALPIIFNTKNPISKLITMFQVEPNNIVSNYIKDMPREAKNKAQLVGQATKLMIASYAFNTIAMAFRGGNEVLPDPIRWVSYLIKSITGDDDEKEKARTDLTESILGNLPFVSNLAGFVGMEDIGRVPISNAMPNVSNLVKLADGDSDNKYKAELAIKELSKPLLYLGLPVGGAQIKKTIEGIATVKNGGSYKTNKNGEKELQFPVENTNIGHYIQAGIFGKYSLSDAKTYADRGYKTLSAKQTKMYEESNIPYKELLDYLDAGLTKTEDKIEYISSKKMNTNQKWGIYTNDIFSKTERDDGGSQLSDAQYITSHGVSKSDFIEIYNKAQEYNISVPTETEYEKMRENEISLEKYIDYQVQIKQATNQKRKSGELSETQSLKNTDRIQILLDSKYSDKEIKAIYENYIKNKNDTEYSIINKTGINIKEYLKYKQQDFEADIKDDGTTKGKTISGSGKKKTYDFVNKMNITYEQRLMLLGMKYTLTDTEQTKLYNYVKSLNCTQNEMQDIFENLKGFTVYKNGRVTW